MSHSKYQEKKELLFQMMKEQKFPGNKLPTEEELTHILDASRGTIREILRELERQGFINKRHSIGNFILPSAFTTKMRIDLFSDFKDLIIDGGYIPEIINIPVNKQEQIISVETLAVFSVQKAEDLIIIKRLYKADGRPAILSRFYLPCRIISKPIDSARTLGSLYSFFEAYTRQVIDHSALSFGIRILTPEEAGYMGLPAQKPLLFWNQIFYNFYDEVICNAHTFFDLDVVPLTMIRK